MDHRGDAEVGVEVQAEPLLAALVRGPDPIEQVEERTVVRTIVRTGVRRAPATARVPPDSGPKRSAISKR